MSPYQQKSVGCYVRPWLLVQVLERLANHDGLRVPEGYIGSGDCLARTRATFEFTTTGRSSEPVPGPIIVEAEVSGK